MSAFCSVLLSRAELCSWRPYACPCPVSPCHAIPLYLLTRHPARCLFTGSGKTSLLAILAGSSEDLDKRSSLSGTVLIDGHPIQSAQRRKVRRSLGRLAVSSVWWHVLLARATGDGFQCFL